MCGFGLRKLVTTEEPRRELTNQTADMWKAGIDQRIVFLRQLHPRWGKLAGFCCTIILDLLLLLLHVSEVQYAGLGRMQSDAAVKALMCSVQKMLLLDAKF